MPRYACAIPVAFPLLAMGAFSLPACHNPGALFMNEDAQPAVELKDVG